MPQWAGRGKAILNAAFTSLFSSRIDLEEIPEPGVGGAEGRHSGASKILPL